MGIEYSGTVDGAPAKVVYYPERKQTQIYWGGMGRPDGLFHNHMTIQDANPDAVHFLRVNGRIVVDMSRTRSHLINALGALQIWMGSQLQEG